MRIKDRKRVTQIIRQIHRLFPKYTTGRKPKIASAEALEQVSGSHVSIIRARRALGVISQKIAGRWYWMYPKRTLAEALEYMSARHVHNKGNAYKAPQDFTQRHAEEAQEQLTEYLSRYSNYCSSALDARDYLRGLHIHTTGKAISTARKEMEIKNVLIDGHWYWVWGGPEVQEWLESVLENGPVPEDDVLKKAWEEKKWSSHVVFNARYRLGHMIPKTVINGKLCWYDINNYSLPAQPDKLDPDVIDITGED
jgi:hypothetical protein